MGFSRCSQRATLSRKISHSSQCSPLLKHLASLRLVNDKPALQAARCSSQWLAYTLPLLPQTGRCLRAHLWTQTHTAMVSISSSTGEETWHTLPTPQYFVRHGLPASGENIPAVYALLSPPLHRHSPYRHSLLYELRCILSATLNVLARMYYSVRIHGSRRYDWLMVVFYMRKTGLYSFAIRVHAK